MKDMVHHPEHYQGKGGLEVWQVQEAFTADLTGVIAGDACALIKYACRWPKKNGVEDLKKIIEYANHLIEKLEEQERPIPEEDATVHRMTTIVSNIRFSSYEVAAEVLRNLKTSLANTGHISILNFLNFAGVDMEHENGMGTHGWTNLDSTYVSEEKDPQYPSSYWVIRMPKIKNLNKKESN